MYAIYNLIGMANVLISQRKSFETAVLLAASNGIAISLGVKIEPELQEPYDKALAESREKLSEHGFQSAWEAGKNMSIDQAVQFALENLKES
jgi:uncharacterized protein YwgA